MMLHLEQPLEKLYKDMHLTLQTNQNGIIKSVPVTHKKAVKEKQNKTQMAGLNP